MEGARKISLSLAGFVLICFFLPWVQLSCVGMKDSVSGFDLASDRKSLWFIPILMVLILLSGLLRAAWKDSPWVFAFICLVGGSISAYEMFVERSGIVDSPRLVATEWTALFWLALISSLGLVATSLSFYIGRSRSP